MRVCQNRHTPFYHAQMSHYEKELANQLFLIYETTKSFEVKFGDMIDFDYLCTCIIYNKVWQIQRITR